MQTQPKKSNVLVKWWLNIGILRKTLLIQCAMIILPLILCTYFLQNFAYTDYASHVALTSYQYARYTLDSVEAEMLQIKSASNVMLSQNQIWNVLTRQDVAMDPLAVEKVSFWISSTAGIRQHVQKTTLYATRHACEAARMQLPLWTGETAEMGWRFAPQEGGTGDAMSWIQGVYRDEQLVGVLQIDLNRDYLDEVVAKLAKVAGGTCAAYRNDTGALIGGEDVAAEESEPSPAQYSQLPEGYQLINKHEYVSIFHCSSMNMSFVAHGDVALYANVVREYLLSFCLIVGILLILGLLAVILNHFSITRRIKLLSAQIDRQSSLLQTLNSPNQIPNVNVEGHDEIGQLAQNYNVMLELLMQSAQREHQAELLQQTARFSALQAQIQPHFLYNTLESLRMMADENDDPEVSEMLFVLGKLMRGSISGREQEISLSREIENCMYYLKLSKLRFESLEYELDCEIDTDSIVCPRFILQPLVENSIHHGISRSRAVGKVRIHVYQADERVYIDVQDNGAGIPDGRLEEIRQAMGSGSGLKQEQGGIGLCNVHHRLQIYYGGQSGLEILSTLGAGTLCRICIEQKTAEPQEGRPSSGTSGSGKQDNQ